MIDCQQGTPEWLMVRSGIPTASMFDKILTPKRLELSAQSVDYMNALLAERIMGHPVQEHVTFWIERGSMLESKAVKNYEFQRDMDTEEVGFCSNDDGTIGASPDRLVGADGLLEIKCPSEAIHVGYLRGDQGAYEKYRLQCQGQLWITGREWVDIMSYHPDMPDALFRIPRDEEIIAKIDAAVTLFSAALEQQSALWIAEGIIKEWPLKELEVYQ